MGNGRAGTESDQLVFTITGVSDSDNCVLGSAETTGTSRKGSAITYDTSPDPADFGYVDDISWENKTLGYGCGSGGYGGWS